VADSYTDAHLAQLYDLINTWDVSDDFYLDLVMSASSVLDLGCGTGTILKRARAAGHTGHLRGLDPADAMLDVARERTDIEWVLGEMTTVDWTDEFDLALMSAHAFQELITDDDIRATLAGVRRALKPGGRFAFETRNPVGRPWERWNSSSGFEITSPDGVPIRIEHAVHSADDQIVVQLSETYTSALWAEPQVSTGAMRFITAERLTTLMNDAGLAIEHQFGDWDRSPLIDTSPEIITIAVIGMSPAQV
jgi:ubiquinone/menaquinone biosynthesis C-methylase UbiE